MSIVYLCPQGHRWLLAASSLSTQQAQAVCCPKCGALALAVSKADTIGADGALPTETTQPAEKVALVGGTPADSRQSSSASKPGNVPLVPGYEILGELG